MRISLSPLSGSSASEGIGDAVNTLRAELEACSNHTQQALLHYELALLYEQVRDDHSAAKELLLAVNGDSSLHEPLEHLIALMERRRSYVNLGKLLDRLGRIARSPEESVRAQLARGDYLVDQRSDLAGALSAYEQAAQLMPDNSLVWLSLHYLGARQSDAKLVETALTRRIQLAHHKGYRDSLRLQLARFQAMRGRQDLARATVEAATSPHSPTLYPALLQLEQLAVKDDEYSTRATILEQQAEVLSRGLENNEYARARGVPPAHVSVSRLIDVTLRIVVNLEAAGGKTSRCVDALERAFRFAPTSRVLIRTLRRVSTQDDPGAQDRTLELGQALHGSEPEEVDAALWLDQATAALRLGDTTTFKRSVDQAQNSVVARALQLETYWANSDFGELASVYERLATEQDDASSRLRARLLSALTLVLASAPALKPESKERVLATLNAGGASGADTLRWHLLLAQLSNDAAWSHETVQRALHAGGSLEVTARLQALRHAVQSDDAAAVETHLSALTENPVARRLGLVLRTVLPTSNTDTAARTTALQTLSSLTDGDMRLGLQRFIAELKRQHEPGAARDDLMALHHAAPADLTTTLQLVELLMATDDAESAVRVLHETADAHPDPVTRQELCTQAAILAFRARAPESALRAFTLASQGPASAGVDTLRWALRAIAPNEPAARRKVLDLPTETSEGQALHALERFALEVGFGNQKTSATDALSDASESVSGDVGEALRLARALWTEYPHNDAAVAELRSQTALGRELVSATAFYKLQTELTTSTDTLLALAEEWSTQGSLAAALEWLGVAVSAAVPTAEVKARQAIAARLEAPLADYIRAEATLVAHFAGVEVAESPLDSHAAQLAHAELSSPMGVPGTRARALANIVDVFEPGAPGDYANTVRVMAAYNHLANQNFAEAEALFAAVTGADPSDLAAWEGLVECARAQASVAKEAKALMQVGFLHGDEARAAAALRTAANYFLDSLEEPEVGYQCLARAVELDVSDTTAFTRMLKHAKNERNHDQVVALTTARLTVAESAKELTKLHWERARAYRQATKFDQALADLGNVALLDPTHVGAKALAGDIFISRQDFRSAAMELSDLALLPNAPPEQRRLSAITAIDLFESKLEDIDAALDLFNKISEVNLDLLPVAERLLSACANAKRWEETLVLSSYLLSNLPSASGRAEAARLQLAVHRDELKTIERALPAVEALLTDSPGDPEAVDTLLDGALGQERSRQLLRDHLPSILTFTADTSDVESVARLARVADELGDLELRLLSLGVLVGRAGAESETLREIDQLLGHTNGNPVPPAQKDQLSHLVNDEELGPLIDILKLLDPHLPEVLGPTLSSLGFGRKERRAAQDSRHLRVEVGAWASTFGLRDFEFYLASQSGESITGIPALKEPAIVVGGVDRVLTPIERGRLAASIFALVHGTYACLAYPADKVAALLFAACKVANVDLPGASISSTAELERKLSRELPRKVRKELEPLAQKVAKEDKDPFEGVRAALATLDRVAAVASGDLSQTLVSRENLTNGFGELDADLKERFALQSRFCLSTPYLTLRKQLGVSAK